ncbi:hypothetical protein BD779DRAFT_747223 [Infundibulicybe gibba]|nr:hypothetical protein BD779DRAFT_747223 [Infundibulicybe gibba]
MLYREIWRAEWGHAHFGNSSPTDCTFFILFFSAQANRWQSLTAWLILVPATLYLMRRFALQNPPQAMSDDTRHLDWVGHPTKSYYQPEIIDHQACLYSQKTYQLEPLLPAGNDVHAFDGYCLLCASAKCMNYLVFFLPPKVPSHSKNTGGMISLTPHHVYPHPWYLMPGFGTSEKISHSCHRGETRTLSTFSIQAAGIHTLPARTDSTTQLAVDYATPTSRTITSEHPSIPPVPEHI